MRNNNRKSIRRSRRSFFHVFFLSFFLSTSHISLSSFPSFCYFPTIPRFSCSIYLSLCLFFVIIYFFESDPPDFPLFPLFLPPPPPCPLLLPPYLLFLYCVHFFAIDFHFSINSYGKWVFITLVLLPLFWFGILWS